MEVVVEDELELVVLEEDNGIVEVVVLTLLLDELGEERTTKAPMAIITTMTTAPIPTVVDTPRLVRMA